MSRFFNIFSPFHKIIKRFMKKEVEKRFPQEINDILLKYFLTRVVFLFLILFSYLFIIRTGLNVKFYIAIVTLLIFSFVFCCFLKSLIEYLIYCIKEKGFIGVYKFAVIKTAVEIEHELTYNHKKIKYFLNNFLFSNTKELARKAAEEVIFNNIGIRNVIITRGIYYFIVLLLYVSGYDYIYKKIIGIDFDNFWSPLFWSIHYLWTL